MTRGPDHTRPDWRPDWDAYWLCVAMIVSTRSDCRRAQGGAVIVSADHRIISTGYDGPLPGGPSCRAGECRRGLWLAAGGPHGDDDYADHPDCTALHAEQHAVRLAGDADLTGATCFLNGDLPRPPCAACHELLELVGVERVLVGPGVTDRIHPGYIDGEEA